MQCLLNHYTRFELVGKVIVERKKEMKEQRFTLIAPEPFILTPSLVVFISHFSAFHCVTQLLYSRIETPSSCFQFQRRRMRNLILKWIFHNARLPYYSNKIWFSLNLYQYFRTWMGTSKGHKQTDRFEFEKKVIIIKENCKNSHCLLTK